jgi:hypothetical protein
MCVCFVHCEDEPGKQVKSAIRLKNTSRSHVAFKVFGFFSVLVSFDVVSRFTSLVGDGLYYLIFVYFKCRTILHFRDPPNVFVCPSLVSNYSTKELLHASSWRYPCSWRKYYCNWYYSLVLRMLGFHFCIGRGKWGLVFIYVLNLPMYYRSDFLSSESEWTVFKFVEHTENNEKHLDQKSKIKFKIMSLKVKGGMEYVPELVRCMASGCNIANFSACLWIYVA